MNNKNKFVWVIGKVKAHTYKNNILFMMTDNVGVMAQPIWCMRWRLYRCKNAENIWMV